MLLNEAKTLWLETALDEGIAIPEPLHDYHTTR
jgi:predicted RNase H-like HicB family nuclease